MISAASGAGRVDDPDTAARLGIGEVTRDDPVQPAWTREVRAAILDLPWSHHQPENVQN